MTPVADLLRGLFLRPRDLPDWLVRHRERNQGAAADRSVVEAGYVVFDTELTGMDFKRDSLISIGAVKMRGSAILPGRTFYRLVQPASELKAESVVVHGLTHSDLVHADKPIGVLRDFLDFIEDAVLVGHFVHIDLNFVNRPLRDRFRVTLRNPAVDTARLHEWLTENDSRFTRHFRGTTARNDLFSLARKYGVESTSSHDAFSDAYLTAQLFQRFLHFLPPCGVGTIAELLKIARP